MKGTRSFCGIVLAVLVLLPGCVYRKQSFNKVMNDNSHDCNMQNNVMVQVKHLTHKDMVTLFGKYAHQLIGAVEIVHVSIHNMSKQDYYVLVDLPLLSYYEVMQAVEVVKAMQQGIIIPEIKDIAIVLGISSLITGAAVANFVDSPSLGTFLLSLMSVPTALIVVPFGMFIQRGISYRRFRKDIQEKTFCNGIVVFSDGQHYEKLIFIKATHYKSHFDIVMHAKNANDNCVVFKMLV